MGFMFHHENAPLATCRKEKTGVFVKMNSENKCNLPNVLDLDPFPKLVLKLILLMPTHLSLGAASVPLSSSRTFLLNAR